MTISTSAAPASGVSTEHARILIVDDEDANLMVLRRMLERAGYTNLQTINDSSLAVERFVSFEPDLLVLDLHMPTPDGFEVMAQIEPLVAPDSYVPILVLTADITESTRERALAVGARDFLTKPFRYTELLLRINNLLETRALHTQLHRDKAILEARMREQQATDQARAERRRSAGRRIEAVLASDRNGPTPESGIGLQIVYQPILDLNTGQVLGAEALSRFGTEPQRSPAQWFIEAAEVGLGIQLELAALRRAAEGLPSLPPDAFLSVNLSSETLRSPALLTALDGLPGSRIIIELTEHEKIEDYDQLTAPVARLRERGIRLAVDDAGAGFASLQQILRLKPDIIKLDRTFIEGLADDPVRRALTTALVTFAQEIGATLVAEGIATAPELEALRRIGVCHGQGMFLGEPSPSRSTPTASPTSVAPRSSARCQTDPRGGDPDARRASGHVERLCEGRDERRSCGEAHGARDPPAEPPRHPPRRARAARHGAAGHPLDHQRRLRPADLGRRLLRPHRRDRDHRPRRDRRPGRSDRPPPHGHRPHHQRVGRPVHVGPHGRPGARRPVPEPLLGRGRRHRGVHRPPGAPPGQRLGPGVVPQGDGPRVRGCRPHRPRPRADDWRDGHGRLPPEGSAGRGRRGPRRHRRAPRRARRLPRPDAAHRLHEPAHAPAGVRHPGARRRGEGAGPERGHRRVLHGRGPSLPPHRGDREGEPRGPRRRRHRAPLQLPADREGRRDALPDGRDHRGAAYADANRRLVWSFGIIVVLGIGVGLIALLAGRSTVVAPIERLRAAMAGFRAGDVTRRAGDVGGPAEIAELGTSFDAMADEIQHRLENQQRLLDQLEEASEAERQTIAAGIHDEVLQTLSAVGIRIQLLRRGADERQQAELDRAREMLDATAAQLRGLLFDLRPPEFDRIGLTATLRETLEVRLGDELDGWSVTGELGPEVPDQARILLYRIALQALANIRQHAGARRVDIRFATTGTVVTMEVSDDGHGFDVTRVGAEARPGHIGLQVMRDRAQAVGGEVTITSEDGTGTTVRADIPFRPEGRDGRDATAPSDPDGPAGAI